MGKRATQLRRLTPLISFLADPRHKEAHRNLGITLHKKLSSGASSIQDFRAGVRKLLVVYHRALALEEGSRGDRVKAQEIKSNIDGLCKDVVKQCKCTHCVVNCCSCFTCNPESPHRKQMPPPSFLWTIFASASKRRRRFDLSCYSYRSSPYNRTTASTVSPDITG